jgi:hypothetical protein
MWLILDQIKSKQCHFDVHRFSASLMHEQLAPSCYHKTKCIVHQSNNNMSANGTPTTFQFDTFPTALQNASGQAGKLDVRLAKHFVQEMTILE